MTQRPFLSATRESAAFTLEVLEGKVPDDLYGHVFFNSPVGTVNSTQPLPKTLPNGQPNPEYGNALFNGDGYLFRFDLDQPGKISVKGELLKTPCYFADEATRYGTSFYAKGQQFRHLGMSRESFTFGVRNQVNTAVNPFRFPDDANDRLTVNFDAGRPWEVDVESLKLKSPIGKLSDWKGQLPGFLQYIFRLNSSTAHPSFDPNTKEFFTINFTKDYDVLMGHDKLHINVMKNPEIVEEWLEQRLHKAHEKLGDDTEKNKEHLRKLFRNAHLGVARKIGWRVWFWQVLFTVLEAIYQFFLGMGNLFVGRDFPRNGVYLLRWMDADRVDSWEVVDQATGQPLVIEETMHQTNYTRDYIVLIDSAVKFAIDILIKNPFPHNENISRLIRDLTAKAILPYTPVYIISRKDLDPAKKTVPARRTRIEVETVHFSCDYENPDGKITLHGAHNCANCAAEWVRSYDHLPAMDQRDSYPNTVGILTTGEMAIGRIGKFVIDGETGAVERADFIIEKGFEGKDLQPEALQGHTWSVGLHTQRGIISPTEVVPRIKTIYWQSYGLDPRFLTDFIQGLYTDYRNRIVPVEDLMRYYRIGLPFALLRQDTERMTLTDWYIFGKNENFRSLQFIPRKGAVSDPADPEWGADGYIFCTMVNGEEDLSVDAYSREIWIFDARDLRQGPVCKLSHPELDYAFTIHSAWLPAIAASPNTYRLDIEADYEAVIRQFRHRKKQRMARAFMAEHVYPQFEAYRG